MAAVSAEQDLAKMSQASQTCSVCSEQDLAKMSQASQTCSVCLDDVTDSSKRSFTKLECGHHFHLDCIGSAFNAKGAMECPNCRHVENGNWLYAKGSYSTHEFIQELLPDEHRDLETAGRVGLLPEEQRDLTTSGRVGLLPDEHRDLVIMVTSLLRLQRTTE